MVVKVTRQKLGCKVYFQNIASVKHLRFVPRSREGTSSLKVKKLKYQSNSSDARFFFREIAHFFPDFSWFPQSVTRHMNNFFVHGMWICMTDYA